MHSATLTLSLATAAGVVIMIVSDRLSIPSIVLLLLGGVAFGPELLGWVQPASLGTGLETVVGLAVALILFEGGLSLDPAGYRRAPAVIKRMLTIGPLVTWLGTAVAAMWILEARPGMALMLGSLVIVTGPTVISPLLRRLHIRERIHHVLFWEGVLIDAVGVFVAVMCYEWLTVDETYEGVLALGRFGLRLLVGAGMGAASGLVITTCLHREWIPVQHVSIFVLAAALATFGVSDVILDESGILATVVAGLVVGLRRPPHLEHVKRFGLQLTELAVGVVFVLLAAKLDLGQFRGWALVAMVAIVVFILRPIGVWLATRGQQFELREKLLLSWIAPRGIVAATMASLFSSRLAAQGHAGAAYLETFTYAVIAATVTVQGLSAPWVVRALGLQRVEKRSWVLLGEPVLITALGRGLRRAGVPVVELSPERARDAELPGAGFYDIRAVLCAHTSAWQNTRSIEQAGLCDQECFYWGMRGPGDEVEHNDGERPLGQPVWGTTMDATEAIHALQRGSAVIDVVEVGSEGERGRFGANMQPLFWVSDGAAEIVSDPTDPGPARGELVVVLRRRVARLAELIQHVDIIDDPNPSLPGVIERLVGSAARVHPNLPAADLIRDISNRWSALPVAVGSGVAIPHAYWRGLERSACFLGVLSTPLPLDTPDRLPVELVFLVLSPVGGAKAHLDSLATISSLGQEPDFLRLLARQRVPDRVARLLKERA